MQRREKTRLLRKLSADYEKRFGETIPEKTLELAIALAEALHAAGHDLDGDEETEAWRQLQDPDGGSSQPN